MSDINALGYDWVVYEEKRFRLSEVVAYQYDDTLKQTFVWFKGRDSGLAFDDPSIVEKLDKHFATEDDDGEEEELELTEELVKTAPLPVLQEIAKQLDLQAVMGPDPEANRRTLRAAILTFMNEEEQEEESNLELDEAAILKADLQQLKFFARAVNETYQLSEDNRIKLKGKTPKEVRAALIAFVRRGGLTLMT